MRMVTCWIAVLLLLAPAVTAQQEGQVPYIETLEVRVHTVDVIVTDGKGRPVTGLGQQDFELVENGLPKPITNFSAYAATGGKTVAPPATNTPEPAGAEQRPPRKFIFYVDEMALVRPTQKKLRAEVDRLIDTVMEPGDAAMVLRPAEEKKLAAPFTTDRELIRTTLRDAIDQEEWRASAPIFREARQFEIEMSGADTVRERRIAARRWSGFVLRRVKQRLGQLHSVVNAAAEVEGRKVLVLITESLPLEPGREAFTYNFDATSTLAAGPSTAFGDWNVSDLTATDWVDLTPVVEEIGRSAATNGIAIYAMQPEYGFGLLAPGGEISTASPSRQMLGVVGQNNQRQNASVSRISGGIPTTMINDAISNTGRSLDLLAEKTGGKAYVGAGRLDDFVNGIASDVGTYYSLGFRAGESLDAAQKIEVRVKGRPDLRVRARKEVIRKSPEREMLDRVVARLFETSNSTNELGIHLESKPVAVAADKSYKTYWVAARVPLSSLTFLPDGDSYTASFSVHYAAMGEQSDFVSGTAGTQVVRIPAAQFGGAQSKEQYTYVVPMNLRSARHTIAIGVLDTVSHLSGFATTEITVQ